MKEVEYAQISEDVEISIRYRLLEARKSTSTFPGNLVKYPVSIYLGEAIRSAPESAFLPFVAAFESKPEVVSFKVKGEVFVKGPPQIVKRLVLSENGRPPRIWSRVYQDILGVISNLAKYLEVPPPKELGLKR